MTKNRNKTRRRGGISAKGANAIEHIVVFALPNKICQPCENAKEFLKSKGYDFELKEWGVNLTADEIEAAIPNYRSTYTTFPKIFINGHFIGGNSELQENWTEIKANPEKFIYEGKKYMEFEESLHVEDDACINIVIKLLNFANFYFKFRLLYHFRKKIHLIFLAFISAKVGLNLFSALHQKYKRLVETNLSKTQNDSKINEELAHQKLGAVASNILEDAKIGRETIEATLKKEGGTRHYFH